MGIHQDGRLSQAEFRRDRCSLLITYINDIDDGITSSLLKYADDTKLLRKVGTQDDCEALQNDLHTMHKWSEDWQMLFNIDKCKCLHTGYGNNLTSYQLGEKRSPYCYTGKRSWHYCNRKPESQ